MIDFVLLLDHKTEFQLKIYLLVVVSIVVLVAMVVSLVVLGLTLDNLVFQLVMNTVTPNGANLIPLNPVNITLKEVKELVTELNLLLNVPKNVTNLQEEIILKKN